MDGKISATVQASLPGDVPILGSDGRIPIGLVPSSSASTRNIWTLDFDHRLIAFSAMDDQITTSGSASFQVYDHVLAAKSVIPADSDMLYMPKGAVTGLTPGQTSSVSSATLKAGYEDAIETQLGYNQTICDLPTGSVLRLHYCPAIGTYAGGSDFIDDPTIYAVEVHVDASVGSDRSLTVTEVEGADASMPYYWADGTNYVMLMLIDAEIVSVGGGEQLIPAVVSARIPRPESRALIS